MMKVRYINESNGGAITTFRTSCDNRPAKAVASVAVFMTVDSHPGYRWVSTFIDYRESVEGIPCPRYLKENVFLHVSTAVG